MKYLTAVDAPGLPREKHTYLLFWWSRMRIWQYQNYDIET